MTQINRNAEDVPRGLRSAERTLRASLSLAEIAVGRFAAPGFCFFKPPEG